MNARRIVAWTAAALMTAMIGEGAIACSASWVIDTARRSRDTDRYRAARDVAEDFIDAERWEKDESTLDAGAGTLISEMTTDISRLNTHAELKTAFEANLGNRGTVHGRTATGEGVSDLTGRLYGTWPTVRDHMRLHVKEFHDVLTGVPTITRGARVLYDRYYAPGASGEPPVPARETAGTTAAGARTPDPAPAQTWPNPAWPEIRRQQAPDSSVPALAWDDHAG